MHDENQAAARQAGEERTRVKAYELWQQAGEPAGREQEFWHQARKAIRLDEKAEDETIEESFPASDPPANSGITGPGTMT